jgi:hypothetical protein
MEPVVTTKIMEVDPALPEENLVAAIDEAAGFHPTVHAQSYRPRGTRNVVLILRAVAPPTVERFAHVENIHAPDSRNACVNRLTKSPLSWSAP